MFYKSIKLALIQDTPKKQLFSFQFRIRFNILFFKMHFSHALVTALSVIATQSNALPLRNGAASLQSRGINGWQETAIDTLTSRGLNIDAARESVGVFARYADVKDEGERNLFIARDLSKRGILDMLVAALRDLIVELLGKGGQARKRDSDQTSQSLQQLTGLDFSTKNAARQSWSQMLDALSKALEQESKTLKSKAGNTTASASASASAAGGEKAKGTATSSVISSQATGSVNGTSSASASVDGTAPSSSVTAASAAAERKVDTPRQGNKAAKRDNIMDLAERQEEGVTGLLQVLRNLVDAILNTLLPMSSRSEDSGSESSSSSKECPPAGTPNDGMYRPGCPGYGRREVTDALLQVRDAASSSQSLQELMPLLEELIQRIPEMMGGSIGANANANTTTASAQTQNGSAKASSDGSASTSTKQKTTAAPMSAAKLSINARSLLEADGFEMEKRQSGNSLADAITQLVDSLLEGLLGTETNSTNITDATGAAKKNKSSSDDSSSSSSSLLMSLLSSLNKRDGGLNVEGLNNILGNLLSGQGSTQSAGLTNDKRDGGLNIDLLNNLLGNLLSGSGSSQSSNLNNGNKTDDKRDGGLNLNLLNNLLGNLLSGSGSKQSSDSNNKRDGGLNIDLLNNLLGNLLSGDNSAQSADSNNKRDGGLNLNLLNGLLGNLLSGDNSVQSSDSNNKRDGGLNLNLLNNLLGNLLSGDNSSQSSNSNNKRADFQPVWSELKNLGNKHFSASAAAERRDGSASFTPVWTSFRDMVDDAYKHGVQRRSPLPSPSPKVDTSAFTHAAATFMKQTIFKQHDRRAINGEQFQPLMNAAGSFAKSQMKEWTDALNEHSSKHGKIHA